MTNKLISFILPCYNESRNLIPLIEEIKKNVPQQYDVEFIFINDGSKDDTLEVLKNLANSNKNYKVISFYRNFGHQAVLMAGIKYSKGDIVINMDADFQHPPEKISSMLKLYELGHDLVVCKKIKSESSSIFYKIYRLVGYTLFSLIGENKIHPGVSDFRLIDKKIVDHLKKHEEVRFILRGLVMTVAKNPIFLPYKVESRKYGSSGYNLKKHYDLFIYQITSFTLMPLRMASILGLILVFISLLYAIFIVVDKVVYKANIIEGWTALIITTMALFGFLFIYLGILSEYIGAIFDEVKKRPKYLVDETCNIDE